MNYQVLGLFLFAGSGAFFEGGFEVRSSSVFLSSLLGLKMGRFFSPLRIQTSSLSKAISSSCCCAISMNCSTRPSNVLTTDVWSCSGILGREGNFFVNFQSHHWISLIVPPVLKPRFYLAGAVLRARNHKAFAPYETMAKAAWSAPCSWQNRQVAPLKETTIFFIF